MDEVFEYDRWLEGQKRSGIGMANLAMSQAKDNPDEVAGDLTLAQTYGRETGQPVPPLPMVKPNRSFFQGELERLKSETILSGAPRLADFLRDPTNAALAKDDLPALSIWESAAIVPRGIASAVPAINEGAWGVAAGVAELFGGRNAAGDYFRQMAVTSRDMGEAVAGPAGGWVGQQFQGAARSIGMMAPGIVASIASGGAATPGVMAAFLAPGAISQGGQSTMKGLEAGLSAPRALAYGGADAAAEVLLGRLPVGQLLSDIERGTGFGRMLVNQLAKEIPSEVATTLFQNMNEWMTLNQNKSVADFLAEQPAAIRDTIAQTALATFGIAGAGRVAQRLTADQRAAEGAAMTGEALQNMSAQAGLSQLRNRMPDRFQEFTAKALDGSPVENVFMPGQVFAQYFEDLGVDPFEMADALQGVSRDDLDAALAGDGDLKIPTATYAAYIAGSEHDAFFQANLKFDANAMTAAEAEIFNSRVSEIQQEMWAEAEDLRREDETLRNMESQIYDRIVSGLRSANQSTEVATTNAVALTAFYRTQAQRRGQTIEEYLEAHPLPEFQGARPEGMAFKSIDELTVTLNELRARGAVKAQTPLLDFLREYGGIDDIGGDLASRDADRGRKPGQKNIIRKPTAERKPRPLTSQERASGKKFGADMVAQAAVEAGFMADHPDVAEWKLSQRLGDRVAPDLIPVLMEAIDAELSGGTVSDQDAALDAMEEYLAQIGADLSMTDEEIRAAMEAARADEGRMYAQPAWHGSPHLFDRFTTTAMGSGEGAQAFGWGMYFASRRGVAESYRKTLGRKAEGFYYDGVRTRADRHGRSKFSGDELTAFNALTGVIEDVDNITSADIEATIAEVVLDGVGGGFAKAQSDRTIEVLRRLDPSKMTYNDGTGRLYEVEVPEDSDLGDYDLPMSEQPSAVAGLISAAVSDAPDGVTGWDKVQRDVASDDVSFRDWYSSLSSALGGDRNASEWLASVGVPGHRFLDGVSRHKGEGSHNYVIYSDGGVSVRQYYQREGGLSAVEAVAAEAGVSLSVSERRGIITVSSIVSSKRGEGSGTRVMQALTDYADATGQRIALTPSGDFGGSVTRLREFYKRFGFVENKGKSKDYDTRETMVRNPKTDGALLFQRQSRIRGSFEMRNDGQSIIRLFESANLSTVQHELGHLFLTFMQDDAARGDAVAVAEYEAIKGWWRENAGAVAADGMKAMPDVQITADDVRMALDTGSTGDVMKDGAIDVGMQEQWARGYEAYLMEGKAPSLDLKTIFSKMSAWMTSVYRRLRGLNVDINPEIRAVFDRMLATDAEIEQARRATGEGGPVFASAEMMGLTDEEYGRYLKLRDQAEAEARSRVLAEVMEPIKRQREQWWKEETEAVRADVTRELQANPVFRAVQELRFGKGFDGQAVAQPKLDRVAIERDYSVGYLAMLPGVTKDGKGHRNAVWTNEGGSHPEIIAGVYGFPSGKDMLDALAASPPISEAIEAETKRIMDQRHGDALNDGEIELIALDAVHSEKRTEWIAAELKAVSAVAGIDISMTAKEARIVARDTLDRMAVKDAVASQRYLAAERKAANEAERLARQLGREGVWQQAAQRRIAVKARGAVRGANTADAVAGQIDRSNASTGNFNETVQKFIEVKRRQLLNHALYMESRKSREFMEKVEDKAAKLNKSDKQLSKRADVSYIKAARQVAAKFGLVRGDTEFDVDAWLVQLQIDDPVSFSAIQDAIVTYTRDAKPYKTMTVSEFGALNDAIDSLLEVGKRFKDLEIEGKRVDKGEAIEALNAVLEGRGPGRQIDRNTDKLPPKEKAIRTVMGWASALRRVEGWARVMDDGDQGVFTRYLVRPVMDALDSYKIAKSDKMTKLLAIIDARRETLTGATIHAPELGGFTFSNKAALIHAILHTGNDSNMAKLLVGNGWSAGFVNQAQAVTAQGKPRFRRDGSPVMTKGELDRSRWDGFMDRMIAEGRITADDIQMVNAIWDLMEEIKRPAQTAHKKMFGFYFKEIEAAGYDTAAGRLKGGYVPAIVDGDFVNDGVMRDSEAALDQQAAGFMLPTAGTGFTKARVEGYKQKLKLDLTLLPAHMDKVLRFTHLDPAVRQTHGIIVDRRFADRLAEYDPTLVDNLLVPWLGRVARQSVDVGAPSSAGRSFDNVLRGLRRRVGFNTMFANVVNVIQQVTGLSVAATLVKPSLMKNATIRFAKDMEGSRAEVFAMSPYMLDRVKNATRETQMRIQDVVKEPTTYNDFQKWVDKHGYFAQQAVQNWVDVPVWMAAFDQAVADGMTETDAVFEADSTIRRTMGGMNPEDVSMFESGPAWKRIFTMFYTYFNGQANHLVERSSTIWRMNGWGGKGKLFSLYLFGVLAPALGAELIAQAFRGGLEDEDDDGYWDDLLGLFFSSQARYGTAMVPVAGQLTQLVFNQFNDERYDDKLSPSPAISTLERSARAFSSVPSAAFGDGRVDVAVGDGLNALALITGVPLNWLAKPMGYAASVAEGRSNPEGVVDVMQGVISGRDGTAN